MRFLCKSRGIYCLFALCYMTHKKNSHKSGCLFSLYIFSTFDCLCFGARDVCSVSASGAKSLNKLIQLRLNIYNAVAAQLCKCRRPRALSSGPSIGPGARPNRRRGCCPGHGSFVGFDSEMEQPQTRVAFTLRRFGARNMWLAGVLKRKQIVVWITTKVHSKLCEARIPPVNRSGHRKYLYIHGHSEKFIFILSNYKGLLNSS